MKNTLSEKLADAIALQQQGKYLQSIAAYEEILTASPEHESANVNLGILHFQAKQHKKAFTFLEKAATYHPNSANAHFNLAYAFMQVRNWASAITHFRQCVTIQPQHFPSHLYLANCLHTSGDCLSAFDVFTKAYSLKKDSAELLNNWTLCCIQLKRFDQAEKIVDRAIELFPNQWELYGNKGILYKEKWQLAAAESVLKKALSLGGDNSQVHHRLAGVYHFWNQKEQALTHLKKARGLDPDNQNLHSDYLYHLNYYAEINNQKLFQEHLRWGEKHAPKSNALERNAPLSDPPPLKVGLLSGDFCHHPVAVFLLGWLDKIDKQRITLHAYAEVRNRDSYTDRIKKACVSWTETNGLGDLQIAEQIKKDGIHVLIDLSGHTKGNRLRVMSYAAAPVQVSYLGYINTTGVSAINYRIVDEIVNPPDSQASYVEKLAYLPNSYTCYEPADFSVEKKPTPALDNGYITFGSFNNPTKINSSVVGLWSRLLREMPGSRLLLKARHFKEEEGKKPIVTLFEKEGIGKECLIFEGPSDLRGYLQAYNKVDIALDTFPHNGGTTTHDALFMSVPVVGLVGNSYVSRMGLSIMTHLGYPEWMSENEDQFLENVREMNSDFEKLNDIRKGLREKFLSSSLCDGPQFAKEMESLLYDMYRNNCD